jgi:hypothetical protein
MRPTGLPRTIQDARTFRSLPRLNSASDESGGYTRLAQLAREKSRLLEEQLLWQRKLDRIRRRLAEIAVQTDQLSRPAALGGGRAASTGERLWHEIEFPY